MAAYRSLEVTLISAKDLKDVNFFSRMDVYAVAAIAGDPKSKQRTPADKEGGRNPNWNATLRFTVPAADPGRLVLHVLLRSERAFGDRDVGEVHVPLKELMDAAAAKKSSSSAEFVSYQVRKPNSGKAKGVLNLSYKFTDIDRPAAPPQPAAPKSGTQVPAAAAAAAYPPPSSSKGGDEPVTAYPVAAGSSYPPPGAAYPPPYQSGYGYGAPPAHAPGYGYGAPPAPGYGYGAPPPQGGYGYPPAGYGYPPPAGPYGYGSAAAPMKPAKKNKFGMGLGAGLLGGAIGGMMLGDMVSDASAYDSGYDAGFGDGMDF